MWKFKRDSLRTSIKSINQDSIDTGENIISTESWDRRASLNFLTMKEGTISHLGSLVSGKRTYIESDSTVCSATELVGTSVDPKATHDCFVSNFLNCIVIGLPFLQIHTNASKQFIAKHKLIYGKTTMIMDRNYTILKDAENMGYLKPQKITYLPGGHALSVAMVCQFLLPEVNSCVFLGAKGDDKESDVLLSLLKETLMSYRLQQKCDLDTGIQLIFHVGKRWAEVSYVDAANASFTQAYVDRPFTTMILERANFYFIAEKGLFLMSNSANKLVYYCNSRFKVWCTILSIPEILIKVNTNLLKDTLIGSDLVFLHFNCVRDLCKRFGIVVKSYQSMSFVVSAISNWINKQSNKSCALVVHDSVRKAYFHPGEFGQKPIKFVSRFYKKAYMNTTYGLEHSFVGAFLAVLTQGYSVNDVMQCSFWMAMHTAKYARAFEMEKKTNILNEMYSTIKLKKKSSVPVRMFKRKFVDIPEMPFRIFNSDWARDSTLGASLGQRKH